MSKTILASAALLLSMTALANQPTSFGDLDANRNGSIDKQEAKSHDKLAESFETADRNQDGKLDPQEFTFAMAKIRSETDPSQRG